MLEIDERALRPQSAPELVPRDDVARVLEHEAKDFERLLLQTDAAPPSRSSRDRQSSSNEANRTTALLIG